MGSKISFKHLGFLVCIGGILGVMMSVAVIFSPNSTLPIFTNVASILGQERSALPVRLRIPKININAPLEYVSLTSQGAVGVPKSITNAAWFNLGPRPGEEGNAIIDGHFGYGKDGTPAIFNNLYKLQKGDKLYVEDEKGRTIIFIVREIKVYNKDEDTSGVFSLSDGKAHLNLITCDGVWIKELKTYSNRLVVFADRE